MKELVKAIQAHEEWLIHKAEQFFIQNHDKIHYKSLDLDIKYIISFFNGFISKTVNQTNNTLPTLQNLSENSSLVQFTRYFISTNIDKVPLSTLMEIMKSFQNIYLELCSHKKMNKPDCTQFVHACFDFIDLMLVKEWESKDSQSSLASRSLNTSNINEENLRTLINAISQVFILIDTQGSILVTNKATAKILQFPATEIEGMNLYSLLPLDVAKTRKSMIQSAIRSKKTVEFHDESLGRFYLNTIYPIIDKNNKVIQVVVYINDFTENKKTTKALKDSKTMLRTILDSLHVRVFWKDLDSIYMGCNSVFAQDAGLEEETEIIGKTDWDLAWKEFAEKFILDDKSVIDSNKSRLNFEETRYAEDNTLHWYKTSKIPLKDSTGNVIGVLGTYEDISPLKTSIKELELSEERYRILFENSPTPLWEEDFSKVKKIIDGLKKKRVKHFEKYFNDHPKIFQQCIRSIKVININKATLNFLNIHSKEDVLEANQIVIDKNAEKIFKQELLTFCGDKSLYKSNMYKQLVDGQEKWIIIHAIIPAGYSDTWSRVFVSVMDITEQKHNQDALFESENKYKTLFENANDAIFILNDLKILDCNTKTLERFQYDKQSIIGKTPHIDLSPKYQPDGQLSKTKGELLIKSVMDGENILTEWNHKSKDGSEFLIEVSLNKLQIHNGNYVMAIFRDITERKKTENAILASEKKFRTLFETMAQGVVYQNKNGEIISVNPAAELILGYTEEEMMGKTSNYKEWRAIKEDGSPLSGDNHPAMIALRTGKSVTNVTMGVYNYNEDEYKWILVNAKPIFNEGNLRPDSVATTFDDITHRVRDAEKLRNYAETQKILLQEVNHRVKNNLSAIISMLHKEMDRAEQKGFEHYIPLINNLKIRVDGLLTVHTMLSQNKWQPILLNELCEKIITNIIQGVPTLKNILLHVNNSSVLVNSRIAQNLSIVLNELATNSIKHTNEKQTSLKLKIQIHKRKNQINLKFKDNGPGFPKQILKLDKNYMNIGFELVKGIVEHSLNGKIKLSNEKGAVVNLTIPNPDIDE